MPFSELTFAHVDDLGAIWVEFEGGSKKAHCGMMNDFGDVSAVASLFAEARARSVREERKASSSRKNDADASMPGGTSSHAATEGVADVEGGGEAQLASRTREAVDVVAGAEKGERGRERAKLDASASRFSHVEVGSKGSAASSSSHSPGGGFGRATRNPASPANPRAHEGGGGGGEMKKEEPCTPRVSLSGSAVRAAPLCGHVWGASLRMRRILYGCLRQWASFGRSLEGDARRQRARGGVFDHLLVLDRTGE